MAPEEPPKALTKNPLDTAGKAVAANVKRLIEDQNLTYVDLSERLTKLGRSIPTLGLRKIVAETRRVDADDLVALAAALGVSPVTLLMPWVAADSSVTVARADFKASVLWEWLIAEWPFPGQSLTEFFSKALPPWKLETVERRIFERGQALSHRVFYNNDEDAKRLVASRATPELLQVLRKIQELGDDDAGEIERLLTDAFKMLGVADGDD